MKFFGYNLQPHTWLQSISFKGILNQFGGINVMMLETTNISEMKLNLLEFKNETGSLDNRASAISSATTLSFTN